MALGDWAKKVMKGDGTPATPKRPFPGAPLPHLDISIARQPIPLQRFEGILVVPTDDRRTSCVYWPDSRWQANLKGRRFKIMSFADAPEPEPEPVHHVAREAIWIGRLDSHFGHFVLEVAPRLAQAMTERPSDLFVFCSNPDDHDGKGHPGYFGAVLDWFGVPRDQVHVVEEPTRFATLRAGAQPEYMNGPGASNAYLDALDHLHGERGLAEPDGRALFVTRAEMPIAKGRLAGEGYMAEALAKAGLDVIVPEAVPLRAQLEAYAQASLIIFSEGSALHGRQLLGRLPQDILVINRRAGSRLAQSGLLARVDRLAYYDGVRGEICTLNPGTREANQSTTLSVCEAAPLREMLTAFGIDLSAHWDDTAFTAARDADVLDYATAQRKIYGKLPPADHGQLAPIFRASLETSGMGHLWPDVAARLERASEIGRINRARRRAAKGEPPE